MREILDVLLGDGLGDAGHAAGVVGARARLEGFRAMVARAGGLGRERGRLGARRVAVGAVAGAASLGLALAGGEIGVRSGGEAEEKQKGRPGGGLPGLHISGQREYYDA